MRAPILVIAALAAAGCTSNDLRENQAAVGAATGALLGAGIGVLAGGDDRRNAVIGAGIGAIAGAAVGDYLQRQEEELNQDLAGTGATVQNDGESLLVTLPATVTFAVDSAAIQPSMIPALTDFAQTLRQYPESYVDVVGHTDSTGAEAYNQDLSERRADSAATFLASRGVRRERLVAYGYGETRPVATNETEAGRAANRRVEVRITPITQG
jgi:outer membrane protein OmpA-like peptidoglycan-associated protein